MTVGSLGDLPFFVDSSQMQTFTDMKWSSEAKYSTHALHLEKGRIELTGFNPDEVSFEMELSAYLGVNPKTAMNKLHSMLKKGTVSKLVIGTTVIGASWVVKNVSREFKHVYKDGELVSATVSVTLLEYE